MRGMRKSASRGFYLGGPPPYGYKRVKAQDGGAQRVKLEPDPTTASIVEQKAFLKSFVEKIEVDSSEVKVIYTIPMLPDNPPTETVGVLPFIHNGPPSIKTGF